MRRIVEFLLIVVIALVSGGGSALFAIEQSRNRGTMAIGPWTAAPGGGDNPYAVAAAAIAADLPFGVAEGIVFTARTDSAGRPLDGTCDYSVAGQTPPARLWTFTVYDEDGRLMANAAGRTGFHAREIVRTADGSFAIAVSAFAQPGNWIPVGDTASLVFVLRLYDTPLTTGLAATAPPMPTIVAEACR